MSAFAIILHEDEPESNDKVRARIAEKYPGSEHFEFSPFTYLVTGPRLVSEVVDTLGLQDDDEVVYGAVLRLNGSFSGRSWTKLWDWLRAADQPQGGGPTS